MKLGKEVEGAFRGLQTLFCSYRELAPIISHPGILEHHRVEQLYICDHEGLLSQLAYDFLSNLPVVVTVEVLVNKFPRHITRSENVRIMATVEIDPVMAGFFGHAKPNDQVKFTANLFVATTLYSTFNTTIPDDFRGDVEL